MYMYLCSYVPIYVYTYRETIVRMCLLICMICIDLIVSLV